MEVECEEARGLTRGMSLTVDCNVNHIASIACSLSSLCCKSAWACSKHGKQNMAWIRMNHMDPLGLPGAIAVTTACLAGTAQRARHNKKKGLSHLK